MREELQNALKAAKGKHMRGLLLKRDVITDILSVLKTDKELKAVKKEIATWK